MSYMFTHKTREKMCAEIYDVFVFCSLSGRTRARWGGALNVRLERVIQNYPAAF